LPGTTVGRRLYVAAEQAAATHEPARRVEHVAGDGECDVDGRLATAGAVTHENRTPRQMRCPAWSERKRRRDANIGATAKRSMSRGGRCGRPSEHVRRGAGSSLARQLGSGAARAQTA